MVQYRDLNAPPSRMLADVVADMKAQGRQSKTGDAGVKDLGETGDVVWPRPDGTPVSVRDVDLELADARQRIEDAETSLSETGARLTDAERAVSDAVASIDGKLDESALDVPETSERLATSMTDVARHLIVTDSAILNHATLIGQTVVDDINVQGKLIGKDGVFTGTVDFENINVSDQVLAERLAGEHIYGTVIEGGEIRTTDGLPGQVILSDEGYVDPGNQNRYPGIRIIPVDSSELVTPPGIGPNENGFIITGGRNVTGGRAFSIYGPNTGMMSFQRGSARSNVAVNDQTAWINAADGNGNQGYIISNPASARVRTNAADGSSGFVEATSSYALVATLDPGGKYMSQLRSNGREAYLRSTSSDGLGRVLSVDSNGVWVKAQSNDGSGYWDHFNLLGDEWGEVTLGSGWSPRTGGGYYPGLRVRRLGGTLEINGVVQGGTSGSMIGLITNPRLRPTYNTFVVTTLASGGLGQAYVGSNGTIMHSYGPDKPGFLAINVSIPLN